MAFTRPTLPELVDRIEQDFISRLTLAGAVLRRSLVRVLSRVLAGAAHMLHGHLDYLARQLFPDKSDREYLLRQAGLFGISPTPATFATGTATATGTNGTVIPAGTVLQRSDGALYAVDVDSTVSGGSVTFAVTAALAGADGTLTVGGVLGFVSPVTGASATATVATSTTDGADVEGTEALRTRFLEHLRTPPQGGSDSDYIAWAKEVSGVTRAWDYPQEMGAGTVSVRFMRDDDLSGPIPDSGEVAAVQAHINSRRPVTATVTVLAPVANPMAVTLHIAPDTSALRTAVTAQISDLLRRTATPGGSVLLSQLELAVGETVGLSDFTIAVPASNFASSTGQIATLGTVTFT